MVSEGVIVNVDYGDVTRITMKEIHYGEKSRACYAKVSFTDGTDDLIAFYTTSRAPMFSWYGHAIDPENDLVLKIVSEAYASLTSKVHIVSLNPTLTLSSDDVDLAAALIHGGAYIEVLGGSIGIIQVVVSEGSEMKWESGTGALSRPVGGIRGVSGPHRKGYTVRG